MAKDSVSISGAELEIMKVLWQADGPITAQDVSAALKSKDWKYSTIATLFSRMVDKGAVTYEKRGRFFIILRSYRSRSIKPTRPKVSSAGCITAL